MKYYDLLWHALPERWLGPLSDRAPIRALRTRAYLEMLRRMLDRDVEFYETMTRIDLEETERARRSVEGH